jgi:TRAP-type C4-dicarboxylate transport system permease small subunit
MNTTNAPLNSFIAAMETQIIFPLVTLLTLAAFVLFIWGVIEYIRNAANDEARKVGTQHILYGLVGLTIIFGAAAIVAIIQSFANAL